MGSYERILQLPNYVDENHIKATFTDGVPDIVISKTKESKKSVKKFH